MRRSLLGGRARTSTVLVALVFVAALVTYILVRPLPASIAKRHPTVPTNPTSQSPTGTIPTPPSSPARSPTGHPSSTASPSVSGSSTPGGQPGAGQPASVAPTG
jgi:hypothetical protein